MASVINLFENVAIFSVDSTDNQLKKFKKKANDGKFEFTMLEATNEVRVQLYTLADASNDDRVIDLTDSDQSFNDKKEIYFNAAINEIQYPWTKASGLPSRIELRRNNEPRKKFCYAVELAVEADYKRLNDTVLYLKEIYQEEEYKLKLINADDDFEMSQSNDDDVVPKNGTFGKLFKCNEYLQLFKI